MADDIPDGFRRGFVLAGAESGEQHMIRAASDVNGLEREQPWTVAAGVCRNCRQHSSADRQVLFAGPRPDGFGTILLSARSEVAAGEDSVTSRPPYWLLATTTPSCHYVHLRRRT